MTNSLLYVGLGILGLMTISLFVWGPKNEHKEDEVDYVLCDVTAKLDRKFYVHKRSGKIIEVLTSNMSEYAEVHLGPRKIIKYIDGIPSEFYNLFEELK